MPLEIKWCKGNFTIAHPEIASKAVEVYNEYGIVRNVALKCSTCGSSVEASVVDAANWLDAERMHPMLVYDSELNSYRTILDKINEIVGYRTYNSEE